MTTSNYILSGIIAILTGSKLWKWAELWVKGKNAKDLKKLEIEEASKRYAAAVFQEYQEKYDATCKEISKFKEDITEEVHTLKNQNSILVQKVDQLLRYITAMYKIAKNNITDPKLVEVVDELHNQAQNIKTS